MRPISSKQPAQRARHRDSLFVGVLAISGLALAASAPFVSSTVPLILVCAIALVGVVVGQSRRDGAIYNALALALLAFGALTGAVRVTLQASPSLRLRTWVGALVIATGLMAGAIVEWRKHVRLAPPGLIGGPSPGRSTSPGTGQ